MYAVYNETRSFKNVVHALRPSFTCLHLSLTFTPVISQAPSRSRVTDGQTTPMYHVYTF